MRRSTVTKDNKASLKAYNLLHNSYCLWPKIILLPEYQIYWLTVPIPVCIIVTPSTNSVLLCSLGTFTVNEVVYITLDCVSLCYIRIRFITLYVFEYRFKVIIITGAKICFLECFSTRDVF